MHCWDLQAEEVGCDFRLEEFTILALLRKAKLSPSLASFSVSEVPSQLTLAPVAPD